MQNNLHENIPPHIGTGVSISAQQTNNSTSSSLSEPCCALKYYPEIEICVKEQKGEQVSETVPRTIECCTECPVWEVHINMM